MLRAGKSSAPSVQVDNTPRRDSNAANGDRLLRYRHPPLTPEPKTNGNDVYGLVSRNVDGRFECLRTSVRREQRTGQCKRKQAGDMDQARLGINTRCHKRRWTYDTSLQGKSSPPVQPTEADTVVSLLLD